MRLIAIGLAVQVDDIDGETVLSRGTDAMRLTGSPSLRRGIVRKLKTGCSLDDLASMIGEQTASEFVSALEGYGWVYDPSASPVPHETPDHLKLVTGYLTLFQPDGAAALRKLKEATVAIIGVGGIGSVVLDLLTRSGIGSFVLADHDSVDESNLNRQIVYRPDDISRPKVEIAARYAESLGARARGVKGQIENVGDLQETIGSDRPDLVVAAGDPEDHLLAVVEDYCKPHKIAYCGAAMGVRFGYWGPLFKVGSVHSLDCIRLARRTRLSDLSTRMERNKDQPPIPISFGPSNTVIAALLAHDIVTYLCAGRAVSLDSMMFFDFTTAVSRPVTCDRRCGEAG